MNANHESGLSSSSILVGLNGQIVFSYRASALGGAPTLVP